MTRVIAGVAGGRRLVAPEGRDTRPTADRAREGLFSTVQSILGPLEGLRAADFYAGSGAVGLEALSRGAVHALMVESAPKAIRAIRDNITTLALPGAELAADRCDRVAAKPPAEPYDFVYLDPPYPTPAEEVTALLEALRDNSWLAPAALVAVERATRTRPPFAWPEGFLPEKSRKYGEATIHYASTPDLPAD